MDLHAGDTPPPSDDPEDARRLLARRWFVERQAEDAPFIPGDETCWKTSRFGVPCMGPKGHTDECGPGAGGLLL